MRRIYTLLLYLLLPLVLVRLLWRSLSAPAYRRRLGERFGLLPRLHARGGVWVHAVSVGEVQASAPLIQRLLLTHPGLPVLVTTTTPTGSHRLTELFGQEVMHVYAPYDVPMVVRRFLRAGRPRLAIFVETEIWPNILDQCARRGIPTLLANARLSERSARGYARLGAFTRETFRRLDLVAAQSAADAGRFTALGVAPTQLVVTGSIKFDVRLPPSLHEQAAVIKRTWCGGQGGVDRPVWIAASTHEGEDEQVLAAHRQVLRRVPDALLVLVPRHPERFSRVGQMVQRQGLALVRRSEGRPCTPETRVFLGDSMGELPMFFAAADLAFVGGSLVPHGGHNLLEPAALGVPVITGPHVFNFTPIAEMLLAADAAARVHDSAALAARVTTWLQDASARARVGENGRRVVEQNRGALDRLLDMIETRLQASAGVPVDRGPDE
jgi:3-deoxy-D-manno-octulosonic-acid transferase